MYKLFQKISEQMLLNDRIPNHNLQRHLFEIEYHVEEMQQEVRMMDDRQAIEQNKESIKKNTIFKELLLLLNFHMFLHFQSVIQHMDINPSLDQIFS